LLDELKDFLSHPQYQHAARTQTDIRRAAEFVAASLTKAA